MFGFVASPCSRCTESTYPAWRGSFCGLARCLGREFGNPSRLLVNRDATFLALLGVSLDPSPPRWHQATCCNPFATAFPVTDEHPAVMHAAAVSVCGLAVKLKDDSHDEGPLRRVLSRIGTTLASPATDRAVAWLNSSSFPTHDVLERLSAQEEIESSSPLSADQPTAEAFGIITGHLAHLLPLQHHHAKLHHLGSALGSLVYWRDAWDDRTADGIKGRFNPFLHLAPAAIHKRIQSAWEVFNQSLSELPFARHQELFHSLRLTTAERHGAFLEVSTKAEKRKKRRRDNKGNRCCDSCDCCDCCDACPSCASTSARGGRTSTSCCDACCDCGPGDTGCCDCCPCDG